jgi:hypothetical protein
LFPTAPHTGPHGAGIPVAAVGSSRSSVSPPPCGLPTPVMGSPTGNARALADEGQPAVPRPSKSSPVSPPGADADAGQALLGASTSSLQPPPSPNRRVSLTPGGTTKVLADLQTGVINARNALENTKAQLRLSQRSVAQLTRQTEDLKEGRERLRLENEGLNNVVARKERLLQEVRNHICLCSFRLFTPSSRSSSVQGKPSLRLRHSRFSSRRKRRRQKRHFVRWKLPSPNRPRCRKKANANTSHYGIV